MNLAKQIFWDYDMTDERMRQMLASGTEWEKIWVASRILERAPFAKVWEFLTLEQIRGMFSKLQTRPEIKNVWQAALQVWSKDEQNT